jgi:hypothetical protein
MVPAATEYKVQYLAPFNTMAEVVAVVVAFRQVVPGVQEVLVVVALEIIKRLALQAHPTPVVAVAVADITTLVV